MKRVFKTRYFTRWMRKTSLSNEALCKSVAEMERGLIDADLGGGVFKKRVALPGRGKRGSTRTLVATNKNDRWFFVVGFEKNARANVSAEELKALQNIAADLLKLSSSELDVHVEDGTLQEICHDCQDQGEKSNL
jgi:hypothetical protein